MRTLRAAIAGLALALAGSLFAPSAWGDQILQYGFEARGPVWKAGSTDAAVKVLAHELTSETAHGGLKSEHLRLQVERGSFVHYTYDLPRAPVTDELVVSLWLKSNRPNVRLFCRMVFPRERDPADLSRSLTALVPCEKYENTRWKLVDLRQPVKELRKQEQMLSKFYKRAIDAGGAYVDQLVLNVFDGAGVVDVWIDDLEVGPVEDGRLAPDRAVVGEPLAKAVPAVGAASRRATDVELLGGNLKVGGQRFFMRGIRHGGTPLKTLRDVGLNTVWLDESASSATLAEASDLGFWMVPSIRALSPHAPGKQVEGRLASSESFDRLTSRFLDQDSVLAWDLGHDLGGEQYGPALRLAEAFRAADPRRPVIADVWDGSAGFSRSLPQVMLGTHRWPLFTSLEMASYREWLENRRRLTTSTYGWTWVQTHLPDWYDRVVYDGDEKRSLEDGAGPQPEHIRLLTYCALAAGYRGLAYWTDRYLADQHQGRDRLLALALLNQELRLLEPILTQATGDVEWIGTSRGEVAAAVLRAPSGVLVLPIWVGPGSQFVPGQAAASEVAVTVPVAITSTAWEVTPGRIQSLPIKRVQGGCQVTLRNFSLTSAVLFASDLGPKGLIVQMQEKQRTMGRLAAQWLCDQAKEELTKVTRTYERIDAQGHGQPDARELLAKAKEALEKAQRQRRDGEHAEAYGSAEVALRALRVLMRTHWDRAVRDLDSPVASPYAGSFFTLPRHWEFLDRLKQTRPGSSLLPHGDFELPSDATQPGWVVQEVPSPDPVESLVRRVPRPADRPKTPPAGVAQARGQDAAQPEPAARGGRQCLMIEVRPRDPKQPLGVLERTYVAVHSPAVRLKPGSLARVSAWVKTDGVSGSVDGAMLFDSAGGEPLAVRFSREPKWKRYSLYRKVPAEGQLSVTLATSGAGKVYFDDVRIEPLE